MMPINPRFKYVFKYKDLRWWYYWEYRERNLYTGNRKNMKELSVGVIITDDTNILLGHTTWGKGWDLPKGKQEKGETYLQTAIRELKEEFGIYEAGFRFETLGLFSYLKNKDLYLYRITFSDLTKEVPLSTLRCTSYFEKDGKQYPEIDKYKIVSLNEIDKYCYPSMTKVLKKIFEI